MRIARDLCLACQKRERHEGGNDEVHFKYLSQDGGARTVAIPGEGTQEGPRNSQREFSRFERSPSKNSDEVRKVPHDLSGIIKKNQCVQHHDSVHRLSYAPHGRRDQSQESAGRITIVMPICCHEKQKKHARRNLKQKKNIK